MPKYHIGRNGPAVCRANPDKPNGRECQFKDRPHGPEAEINEIWEAEQNEKFGLAVPIRKKRAGKSAEALSDKTKRTLSDAKNYSSRHYDRQTKDIAMKLALSNISKLAYTPVKQEDDEFYSEGFSTTHRLELEDSSVGYFKPFVTNTDSEYVFQDYQETSLGAAVNEVNAHRMSKAMGEGYESLVPETVIREHNGELGSIQREVGRGSIDDSTSKLSGDERRAAVFDFVVGSLDRHNENYIKTSDGSNKRLALIDNSFSFPKSSLKLSSLNESEFTDKESRKLVGSDRKALANARVALDEWESQGTIRPSQAKTARARITHLESKGHTVGFRGYIRDLANERRRKANNAS